MRSSERVQLQDRTVLLWENRQLEDYSRQLMISWWCTISTCWHRHHRHLVLTGLRVKSWDDQAIALQRGKRCKRNQRALSKWHWIVGHRTMFFSDVPILQSFWILLMFLPECSKDGSILMPLRWKVSEISLKYVEIWLWVKTLVPSEPQNSW